MAKRELTLNEFKACILYTMGILACGGSLCENDLNNVMGVIETTHCFIENEGEAFINAATSNKGVQCIMERLEKTRAGAMEKAKKAKQIIELLENDDVDDVLKYIIDKAKRNKKG